MSDTKLIFRLTVAVFATMAIDSSDFSDDFNGKL
jgi:hypothetical protein